MLGQAYLQKARETGDPGYYPKAETLFQQALAGDGDDVEAMVGLGTLALARHEFAAALDWGEQARALAPYHAAAYGVIGDAQVELGRYDEAVETVQAMVDLRPDLSSYSRVSYLRELMGDREGALAAMEQAVTAGSGYAENVAWVRVQLGNLHFDGGDLSGAASEYAAALAALPGYAPGLAGQARVAAAAEDLDRAAELYAEAVRAIPLPEFVVAYGDVLSAAGRQDEAAAQYALVAAIQQLYAANGVDTDLELALYTADHGRPEDLPRAVEQARAAGRGAAKHRRLGRARLDALPQRRSGRGGRGQQGGASPRHPQRADAVSRRDDRRRPRRDRAGHHLPGKRPRAQSALLGPLRTRGPRHPRATPCNCRKR